MLQLHNHSPFKASIAVFPDVEGVDTLFVMVKATFTIGAQISVAEAQVPVTMADEYWGAPGGSSIKYASEMHLTKPGTDVVLIGEACAEDEQASAELDVLVSVAGKHKVMRVFGDRYWEKGLVGLQISSPKPFQYMPLVYERAYGGIHEIDLEKNEVMYEARNPVGTGFSGKRSRKEMEGFRLPNMEDPEHLIASPKDQPAPVGVGFIAPSWEPRKSFVGTYDAAWQKKRAPYLPEDFDARFFHAAHPDLVFSDHLIGGEPVALYNVSPNGPIRFNLPLCEWAVSTRISGKNEPTEVNLESLVLEPSDERFTMLWRGAAPCDKKVLNVEQIDIELKHMGGVADG